MVDRGVSEKVEGMELTAQTLENSPLFLESGELGVRGGGRGASRYQGRN